MAALDAADVAELVLGGEGRTVEFKRGLPRPARLARSLAAFANTQGGVLLVGVGDRGELVGAPRPSATRASIERAAREELDPPLAVETGVADVRGVAIVWCSVPRSAARPHAVRAMEGAVYVRKGSKVRAADARALAELARDVARPAEDDELARVVLAFVAERAGGVTIAAFARASDVGAQRARRAFLDLERAGKLAAHGLGSKRAYRLA